MRQRWLQLGQKAGGLLLLLYMYHTELFLKVSFGNCRAKPTVLWYFWSLEFGNMCTVHFWKFEIKLRVGGGMDFYQTSPPQSSTNKIWVYSTGNHYYNKKTRIVTNSSQWRTAVVNYATISSNFFWSYIWILTLSVTYYRAAPVRPLSERLRRWPMSL